MSEPDAGTTGDDASRLLGLVQQWTQRNFPAPPNGHGGPECQWCPLCQLASALRGEHPDMTERIAEAGAAVANALRALTESAPGRAGEAPSAADPASAADGGGRGGGVSGRRAPRPRVQRIVLDEPDGP